MTTEESAMRDLDPEVRVFLRTCGVSSELSALIAYALDVDGMEGTEHAYGDAIERIDRRAETFLHVAHKNDRLLKIFLPVAMRLGLFRVPI